MPRPRKPRDLKIVEGTFRPARDVKQEAEYEEADLIAPTHLEGLALLKWQELEPMLSASGVLKKPDMQALESYCNAYAIHVRAMEIVHSEGPVIETEKGQQKHPAVNAAMDASREMRGLSGLLGLDPASRGKIECATKPDEKKSFGALQPKRKPSS